MYMPYSQATQLILDIFNFKPEKPKYPNLGYANDISELYQFSGRERKEGVGKIRFCTNWRD